MLPAPAGGRLAWSAMFTMATLFAAGVARATVTRDRWRTDLEMLMLGGVVAMAAYGAGALVAALVDDSIL
jgi:VIT1/CCC1 family predicted Fe2+/Mn2+ transporter